MIAGSVAADETLEPVAPGLFTIGSTATLSGSCEVAIRSDPTWMNAGPLCADVARTVPPARACVSLDPPRG